MSTAAPLLIVPFREVRHFQPDDCLHYEPVGIRGRLHHWTIPPHRHDGLHQFQLLTRGAMVVTLDGQSLSLQAPAALMVSPGIVHGMVYQPHSAGCQITVPTERLAPVAAHARFAELLRRTVVISGDAMAEGGGCGSLFDAIEAEFNDDRPGRSEALNALMQLVVLWFLRNDAGALAERRPQQLRDALVHRYRSLLEQHFPTHHQVGFYADALSVTPDHLSRICRAATGLGALELLHQRLIVEARRLLAHTPASVIEVAGELGYDDPAYFSRFFTRATGTSPTAYRERLAAGQGVPAMPTPPVPASRPARPRRRTA